MPPALLLLFPLALAAPAQPLVIAHRGASGYLPEHTLEAAAYAHALGADYIEQDVVFSKDNRLVVLHDIHLESTTDVAARFPGRHRRDGRYYAIDFTWAELQSLAVRERVSPLTGRPAFPTRFPSGAGSFRLCTLEEQLALIQGLNRSTGREVGVYVEFKDPAFHTREGRDLGAAVLQALAQAGYDEAGDRAYVQCFDAAALLRLRRELNTKLRLVLLLESDSPHYQNPKSWAPLARELAGVGPPLSRVFTARTDGKMRAQPWVAEAQRAGLAVHPYTFRRDALPAGVRDFEVFLDAALAAGIDGLFIDHPDDGVRAISRLRAKSPETGNPLRP